MPELSQFKAEFFKALAHPLRIRILDELRRGEVGVNDLCERLDVEQSTLSQQLAVLRGRSIVVGRKDGQSVFYSVRDPEIFKLLDVAKKIFNNHLIDVKTCFRSWLFLLQAEVRPYFFVNTYSHIVIFGTALLFAGDLLPIPARTTCSLSSPAWPAELGRRSSLLKAAQLSRLLDLSSVSSRLPDSTALKPLVPSPTLPWQSQTLLSSGTPSRSRRTVLNSISRRGTR